jgi:hypothetical protein
MADVTQYSNVPGGATSGFDIDSTSRMYNFGNRIAEINPMQDVFFNYLNKVAKVSTDDPEFKFLEQRHQWQRRNFVVKASITSDPASLTTVTVECFYDIFGKAVTTAVDPNFLVAGQVITLRADDGVFVHFKISGVVTDTLTGAVVAYDGSTTAGDWAASTTISAGAHGQVVGSAWAEGDIDPDGWADKMYDRDGYCQIFKTAAPIFSGTTLATRYRGHSDEYKRVWAEKLMEHKMDISQSLMFGAGRKDPGGGRPERYTWGILPYTLAYGTTANFNYASSGYDDILDFLESFFAPETGNSSDKLVLTSRHIIGWLNKLGDGNFLGNTVGSSSYKFDVQNIKGKFGHNVTLVDTIFGKLHFIADPTLRNGYEDYAIAVDMANVKYRNLAANGYNRDTHIITNVQGNNVDGRKDMILTEAGLEISLPETHAVMKWS